METILLIGKALGCVVVGLSGGTLLYVLLTHKARMARFGQEQDRWADCFEAFRLERKGQLDEVVQANREVNGLDPLVEYDRDRERGNLVFQKLNGWDRPTELIQLDVAANTMVRDPAKWRRALELAAAPLDTPVSVLSDLYHATAEKLGYEPYRLTDADRALLRSRGYADTYVATLDPPKSARKKSPAPVLELEEVAS